MPVGRHHRRGVSDKPVYLAIVDAQAEIRDASHLWGSGTYHTTTRSASRWAGDAGGVDRQAGENLVRMASLQNAFEHSAGGVGGVFGSKKLKAIAVKGTADPDCRDRPPGRSSTCT